MARPSEYKKDYCRQIRELAKDGKTERQIAKFFQISTTTLHRWRQDNPEFEESLSRGRKEYQHIQDTLYCREAETGLMKRVKGYKYVETTHETREVPGEDGGMVVAEVKRRTVKHVAPDVTSIKYVLGNRDPERWPKGDSIPLDVDPLMKLLEQVDGATRHIDDAGGQLAGQRGPGEPAAEDSAGRDGDAGDSGGDRGSGASEIGGEYA